MPSQSTEEDYPLTTFPKSRHNPLSRSSMASSSRASGAFFGRRDKKNESATVAEAEALLGDEGLEDDEQESLDGRVSRIFRVVAHQQRPQTSQSLSSDRNGSRTISIPRPRECREPLRLTWELDPTFRSMLSEIRNTVSSLSFPLCSTNNSSSSSTFTFSLWL